MTEYYDYVLGLIPLALIGISGTLSVGGFGTTTAVVAGALVAVALTGHALFVNGPTDAVPTGDVTPDRAPDAPAVEFAD
ncbi:hypothetical protein [Halocalculus aciditolerans]|uniref:Uncharacterized protein n=1 Tax=Halocalculus aciditolerans TaxID=1383812 RepID=A0A830FAY3_9EURY|nr:hypothetical protein [Halocalculus aciditolerans]GGL56521.1 hypothetical protein GCM10009039_13300 [Halocalculus aciditolerans]